MLAPTRCQLTPEIHLTNRVSPALTCRIAGGSPAPGAAQPDSQRGWRCSARSAARSSSRRSRKGACCASRSADDGPGFPPELLAQRHHAPTSAPASAAPASVSPWSAAFTRDVGGSLDLANRHAAAARAHAPPRRRRRRRDDQHRPVRMQLPPSVAVAGARSAPACLARSVLAAGASTPVFPGTEAGGYPRLRRH